MDTPFFVVDIESIINQYQLHQRYLPRFKSYYSVRLNPLPMVMEVITALGGNFNVVSKVNEVISFT